MVVVLLAVTPRASWGQEPGAAQDTQASKPNAADVLRPSFPTLLCPPPLLQPPGGLPAADSLSLSVESILQRRLVGPGFRGDLSTGLYIQMICGSDIICRSYLEDGYRQRYEEDFDDAEVVGWVLFELVAELLGDGG